MQRLQQTLWLVKYNSMVVHKKRENNSYTGPLHTPLLRPNDLINIMNSYRRGEQWTICKTRYKYISYVKIKLPRQVIDCLAYSGSGLASCQIRYGEGVGETDLQLPSYGYPASEWLERLNNWTIHAKVDLHFRPFSCRYPCRHLSLKYLQLAWTSGNCGTQCLASGQNAFDPLLILGY